MSKTWADLGADLRLDVRGTRVRAAVEKALRDAVQSGRLGPGTRMPPSRSLARDLGVARNTVAQACAHVVAEGWLVARSGSRTWVGERAAARRPARARMQPEAPTFRYDLRPGSPDLASFPRAAWQAAARRALAVAPHAALGYGDLRGLPDLRREVAEYLARVRGVRADADAEQIVVCSGVVQALALLCRTLHSRGVRSLAVEEDGHPMHRVTVIGTQSLELGHGWTPSHTYSSDPRLTPGQTPSCPEPCTTIVNRAMLLPCA